MNQEKTPIDDYDLKGDGSINQIEAAEEDLNPMPVGPDDPRTKQQQEKIEQELDELA